MRAIKIGDKVTIIGYSALGEEFEDDYNHHGYYMGNSYKVVDVVHHRTYPVSLDSGTGTVRYFHPSMLRLKNQVRRR